MEAWPVTGSKASKAKWNQTSDALFPSSGFFLDLRLTLCQSCPQLQQHQSLWSRSMRRWNTQPQSIPASSHICEWSHILTTRMCACACVCTCACMCVCTSNKTVLFLLTRLMIYDMWSLSNLSPFMSNIFSLRFSSFFFKSFRTEQGRGNHWCWKDTQNRILVWGHKERTGRGELFKATRLTSLDHGKQFSMFKREFL